MRNYITVLISFMLLIVGSVAAGYFVQNNKIVGSFDAYFYGLIHMGIRIDALDVIIVPFNFNFLPGYLSPFHMPSFFYFMIIGTLAYLYIHDRANFKWGLLAFTIGTVISQIVTAVDWQFVFRQRPFEFLPNHVEEFGKKAWKNWTSFPSGHVRDTTLYSVLIYNFIPRLKWVMISFIAFIAFSRVYVGAHYPTDSIFGILIGYSSANIALYLIKKISVNGKTSKHI